MWREGVGKDEAQTSYWPRLPQLIPLFRNMKEQEVFLLTPTFARSRQITYRMVKQPFFFQREKKNKKYQHGDSPPSSIVQNLTSHIKCNVFRALKASRVSAGTIL